MTRLVYSSDKKRLVELCRELNYSDCEIMRIILRGEYGVIHRKWILLDWAAALEMDASEVLREAVRCGLLANDRMPRKKR